MKSYLSERTKTYSDLDSKTVLIQPVDGRDLPYTDSEVVAIREVAGDDFCLVTVEVDNWNNDLSPWIAPAVFGKEGFDKGAEYTLSKIMEIASDPSKTYFIGGYSLAGLFSLWAAYRTDIFSGVAAASPSVWFPGFFEFVRENEIRTKRVYLSLGDMEEKTRNPVLSTVGDNIRGICEHLSSRGCDCILEWNRGNHFKEAHLRTARGFAWVLNRKMN